MLITFRSSTVRTLKDIVVRKTNLHLWCSVFKDWSVIPKTLVCAETTVKTLPAVRRSEDEIERLSRNCYATDCMLDG